jgi:hypothetical protein
LFSPGDFVGLHLNDIVAVAFGTFGLQLGVARRTPVAMFVSIKGFVFAECHHNFKTIVTTIAFIFVESRAPLIHGVSPLLGAITV